MAKCTFRFRYQLRIRKRSYFLKCRRQFQLFFMKFPKVHSEDLPAAQHRLALPAKFPVTVQRTKFCQMDSGVFFPQFQKRRTLFLFSLKYCLFQDKLCKRPEFIRVASELQSTQKRYQDFLIHAAIRQSLQCIQIQIRLPVPVKKKILRFKIIAVRRSPYHIYRPFPAGVV